MLAAALSLVGCQQAPPSASPVATATPVAQAEGSASVTKAFGETVLAAKNGSYQVQLKPVGEALDIALIKSGGVGDPAFSTGASSTSSGFQETIKGQVAKHPEFREPLHKVLEAAAAPQSPAGLELLEAHRQLAKGLQSAIP